MRRKASSSKSPGSTDAPLSVDRFPIEIPRWRYFGGGDSSGVDAVVDEGGRRRDAQAHARSALAGRDLEIAAEAVRPLPHVVETARAAERRALLRRRTDAV